MTRLSEHIMKVIDVLCLSAVTIHGLVREWLDAEGLGVHPSKSWVKRLLRGMRLSFKKPAKCLKGAPQPCFARGQHAPALHQAVHAVGADRVINIDETSCRLLPVHQTGLGRRGVKQAQPQGNTREATTFTVAFSMGRGLLDMLVQIVQDRRRLAGADLAGAHSSRHFGERLGHDDHEPCSSRPPWMTSSIQAEWDSRGSSSGTWPASTPARPPWPPCAPHSLTSCCASSRRTARRTCSPATWPSSAASRAASRLKQAPRLPAPSSTAWITGWHRLRAVSNAEFRDAVTEAAALHSRDELFSRHIEPEPASEDPEDWAME